MLNRKKKHMQGNSPDSIIGENTICEGKIMSELSLRIEGQIQGEIECAEDLTIGERGIAYSHIHARNVIVAGKIKGDVIAREKLYVMRSGEIIGNINARAIIIEEGGLFQGSCTMNPQARAEEEHVHPKLVKQANKHNHKSEGKTASAN
jgi:cytoskeletal protein CcmA (bactofilin family)